MDNQLAHKILVEALNSSMKAGVFGLIESKNVIMALGKIEESLEEFDTIKANELAKSTNVVVK